MSRHFTSVLDSFLSAFNLQSCDLDRSHSNANSLVVHHGPRAGTSFVLSKARILPDYLGYLNLTVHIDCFVFNDVLVELYVNGAIYELQMNFSDLMN